MVSAAVSFQKKWLLLSENFSVSVCTIFVLEASEWTPRVILPKIRALCVVFFSNVCDSRYLMVQGITTYEFIVSKFEDKSGTWLWMLLIVSVVIVHKLTIAVTSISNMCSASLFKLLLFPLKTPFRMILAVRIYHSKTSPMWLAVVRFLIHIIQLPLCVCRFWDIWLWSNSWKAFQSSLIAPTKLFPLSDFIRWMLLSLPVNFLNKNVKESVFEECAISVWIARL